MVTHQVTYLTECHLIVLMEDGRIKKKGSPSELRQELEERLISKTDETQIKEK